MLLANFNGKEHLRHRAVSLRQHGFLVIKLFGVCKNFSVLELKNRLLALLSWSRLDVLEYYSQQPTKLATQPTTCNQAWNCYVASVTGIAGHWHYRDFPFPIPQVPPKHSPLLQCDSISFQWPIIITIIKTNGLYKRNHSFRTSYGRDLFEIKM